MANNKLSLLLLIAYFVTEIHGNLDFTCVNSPSSRVDVDGDDKYFIGGYLSGDDTDATITFKRIFRTYGTESTDQALPGSSVPASGGRIVRRRMPTGGVQRVGAYYCDARKNGIIERIQTTVMSKESVITPASLSYTASIGESLQLRVNVNEGINTTRWRKNGELIHEWNNKMNVSIDGVSVDDDGIYECHEAGMRQGQHAIFQVNIRECESDKWNPPSCINDCPICLNGGICDDVSGICVCPPGFRGVNCETVHGSNRWGQSLLPGGISIVCSSGNGNDPHSIACDDALFCLPHPYGCSCAAGFQGIDCNQQCKPAESGQFGAGCTQKCHCAPDASCMWDTGECNGTRCADGWSGVNCQQQCTEPGEISGIQMTSNENVLQIDWEPERSICLDKKYIIEYELVEIFHCESFNVTTMENTTALTTIDINVLHNANYTVYIKTQMNGTYTSERQFGRAIRTNQGVPDGKPMAVVTVGSKSTSLSYTWDPLPCESMGGFGHHYVYQLQHANGSVVSNGTTNLTDITFDNLIECTEYSFTVRAANNIGPGPSSETVMGITTPGPVSALMVNYTDDDPSSEVIVTWSPSTKPCRKSGYVITAQLDEIDQCMAPENSNQSHYSRYVDPGEELMKTIMDELIPYSTYTITVKANNSAGFGEEVSIKHNTSISAPTAPPEDVTATAKAENITFRWTEPPCGHRHGPITLYLYFLQDEAGDVIFNTTTQDMAVILSGLNPYTFYNFTIAASTDVGIGPFVTMTKKTLESRSSMPKSLTADSTTKKSITVSWSEPESPNGKITHYMVEARVIGKSYDPTFDADKNGEADIVEEVDVNVPLMYTISNLKPSTDYEIRVLAINGAGPGEPSRIEESTKPATLDDIVVPNDVIRSMNQDTETTPTTASIVIPESKSEFVTYYLVGVQKLQKTRRRQAVMYEHVDDSPDMYIAAKLSKDSGKDFLVGDGKEYDGYLNAPLEEDTNYAVQIGYAIESPNNNDMSAVAWSEQRIDVSTPPAPDGGSALGAVIGVLVVLILVAVILVFLIIRRRRAKANEIVRYSPGNSEGNQTVITLTDDRPQDSTLASAGTSNRAYNETEAGSNQVLPEQAISAKPLAVVKPTLPPPRDTSPDSAPPTPQVPARSKKRDDASATPTPASKASRPIKLEKFQQYVESKRGTPSLKTEYKTLPGESIHPCTAAKDPKHKKNNRYGNIITYDHSRVVLEPLENIPHSDYINASFIDGMYKDKQYIACQGPNTASTNDFWRMIWQYNIEKIVMLTHLVENGKVKCDKYWPDKFTEYGDVMVAPTGEKTYGDYVLRTFTIQPASEGETVRTIYHYHFTSWPDMNVPQAPSLLRFMKVVDKQQQEGEGQMVVHCSAGVGRTGTYITVKEMMEQAKQEGVVDVYAYVAKMRNNRMKMVQTSAQYQFIFDVLLEAFICEDTSMQKSSFQDEFAKLKKVNRKTKKSGLQEQFQTLQKITIFPKADKCSGGFKEENASKNRFADIVPTDSSRPYLMTQIDSSSTNYINAAYIDGTQEPRQHLVTQMPLPETVADIWRVLFDYEFASIVMLNTPDKDDLTTIKYWPDYGHDVTFGPLTIHCAEEDYSVRDIIMRTFQLSNDDRKSEGSRTIRQFALQNWPSDADKPTSPGPILALIECLEQWRKECNNQRVTAHCINGVGLSCAFFTIMLILEQLEQDDIIDVFQTVRKLRLVRPQAVQNLAQYTFCYEAILAHLDTSTGIYENLNLTRTDEQSVPNDADIYANVFT